MINSLRLKGFKNFHDVTLPIGPLTVIVGTNASGKSNLRDAFRFLHGISRGYSLADIVGEKFLEGLPQWKGIRGGIREIASFGQSSFTLEARLPLLLSLDRNDPSKFDYRITVEVNQTAQPLRVVQESLYRNDRLIFDSHPKSNPPDEDSQEQILVRLREKGDGLHAVGDQRQYPNPISFFSNQPVFSQFVSHEEVPDDLQKIASNAMLNLRFMRFLDLSPEAMKVPSIPGQPLGDRGENLSSALQAICKNDWRKRALTEWLRHLTPLDVIDFEFVPDQTGRILLTLVESNSQRTTAYSASDGTLRFLAMMAALMGSTADQFFYFLEEIDNGIHPTRLNLLLQLIEQQAKRDNLQIVTTTHSPQLLAMLSPQSRENAVLVYRLENEVDAHIQRILDIPTAREVLTKQNLARLHESGWLENVVSFAREDHET